MKKALQALNKVKYVLLGALMALPLIAAAVNVTVPSAPGNGYALVSTTTGAWIATTTDPLHVGSLFATSSTATNFIQGALQVLGSTTLQKFTATQSTTTQATTTNSFATTASSTNLFAQTGTIGALTVTSCTGCSGAAGTFDPFTHTSVWGVTTSASSTLFALTGNPSLVASSTVAFGTAGADIRFSSTGVVTNGTWNGVAIGPTFGGTNQTTWTKGDTLYSDNSNSLAKLSIGTPGTTGYYGIVGGVPAWVATSTGLNLNFTSLIGNATIAQGGTNVTTYTTGDTLYASNTNVLSKLGIGTGGFVLAVVNGVPGWVATSTLSTITGTLPIANGGTATTTSVAGGIVFASSTGSGLLSESSTAANLKWDETNKRVGVGSTTPFAALSLDRQGSSASSTLVVAEYAYGSATTTAESLDCRTSTQHHIRIGTSAVTITLTGMIAGQTCRVVIENPNGGTPGTVTWAVAAGYLGVFWPGGTAPTGTATANKQDVYSFIATTASSTLDVFGNSSLNF